MEKLTGLNEKDDKLGIAVVPEGSLGLLAAGYKGVMLWKKARINAGMKNFADPDVELQSKQFIARKREKGGDGK